ncbi:hypothetical protein ZWY2020_019773 [Hordeum vulgare]|nr:hypothetical protein ZWY2020_019773 [Hordeum vulgare]
MAIGAGRGPSSNISTFGADQFDDPDARERARSGLVLLNWWLFSSSPAASSPCSRPRLYVQEESAGASGTLRSRRSASALSLALFYVGTPFYRHKSVTRARRLPARRADRLKVEQHLFVKQGTTLDRSMGGVRIPAASLGSFITISMLVSWSIYDRVLVPLGPPAHGQPRGITLLQRLASGARCGMLVVACACLVEVRRMRVIRQRGSAHGPPRRHGASMSCVFWMLPQWSLLLKASATCSTPWASSRFFYDQSPEGCGAWAPPSSVGSASELPQQPARDNSSTRPPGQGAAARAGLDNLNDSHL